MLGFTRRLIVITITLVCAAGVVGAFRLMHEASSGAKPDAGTAAKREATPSRDRTIARANVEKPDEPLVESDFNEPFRRAMEVYAAEWVQQQKQEFRRKGVDLPSILTSVNYERIGGRKFMVGRLRATAVNGTTFNGAKIIGIVDGDMREAVCATEGDAKTLLTSRECAKAIEETFGVKAGK